MNCPLCSSTQNQLYHTDKTKEYHQCLECKLIFIPTKFYLNTQEEKAHYDKHENNPNDLGYRTFLSRICNPLLERIPPHAKGLDFGCGPGPTLSVMLEEKGHEVDLFDIFYANEPELFNKKYNFITSTEVVEHLYNPLKELELLWKCIKSGGILALMTERYPENSGDFSNWYYIRDPTHVCLFSTTTFKWLAKKWKASFSFHGNSVVLFTK
jgi:2-polyprenyl-3-methyl-5-hydroxy-6-metoxy-1,4-benzoquinol methylase